MSDEEEKLESGGRRESVVGSNSDAVSAQEDALAEIIKSDIAKSDISNIAMHEDAPEEIPKSDINTMEVHHHPEVEKKGFKEYLLEGLMIFLAVMLGFIAENIRENISENTKAKELAHSLYKEIYADSITVEQRMASRLAKENSCIYFINYVKDSSLTEPPQQFFISFTNGLIQSAGILFEPNDGILNQLRNSGALRYFKNNDLQVQIGQLGVAIANIRNRNDKEYSFIELNLRPFSLRHFDFNWYDALTHNGKMLIVEALNQPNFVVPVQGVIANLDQFKRKEAENIASYYLLMLRGTRLNQYKDYAAINHRLMETLRKEYPAENE